MRVLLDQGLPRSAAGLLRDVGIDAIHTGECGLATSSDTDILAFALQRKYAVTDFHAILVSQHATAPSVIRLRIEGLRAEAAASLVRSILDQCDSELVRGAMISVTEDRVRVHYLPV